MLSRVAPQPGQSQSRSLTEIQAGTGKSSMIASFHPHSGTIHTTGIFRLMQIFDPPSALVYFFRANKGRPLFLNLPFLANFYKLMECHRLTTTTFWPTCQFATYFLAILCNLFFYNLVDLFCWYIFLIYFFSDIFVTWRLFLLIFFGYIFSPDIF